MVDGFVVLAVSYGLKTNNDLRPMLRRFVPEAEVQEYQDLLEELR